MFQLRLLGRIQSAIVSRYQRTVIGLASARKNITNSDHNPSKPMNIRRTVVGIFSILCFVALGAACQTQNVATQEINEKAVTPSPTQTKLRLQDDSKRLINPAGWELPDITLFKEVSRERYKTNKSIAKIEQRDYIPLADVIQYADGNTFFDVDRDPTLENKAWLIRHVKVFSAQGQPFCYVMRGDWVVVDESGAIEARAAMRIVLVYTDQDGDGIYEAFQYSAGEMPIIPERLMKH